MPQLHALNGVHGESGKDARSHAEWEGRGDSEGTVDIMD